MPPIDFLTSIFYVPENLCFAADDVLVFLADAAPPGLADLAPDRSVKAPFAPLEAAVPILLDVVGLKL